MKRKILFVDEHKIVNYAGGVEKVICSFANEFVKRNYEITLVCMDRDKGRPLYELDESVKFMNLRYDDGNQNFDGWIWKWKKTQKEFIRTFAGADMMICGHRIEDPKKMYFFDEFAKRLKKVIVETSPDLIISISADGAYIAQKAIADGGIPVIAMCHTDPGQFVDSFSEQQITAWKKCAYVQVLMDSFIPVLKNIGIKNVISIANVVPQIPDDEIRDLSNERNRIITVGRIDGAVKRQDLLIKAFSRISSKYKNWTLHIYGDIANRRYMRKLTDFVEKNDLKGRVFFEGVTDDVLACYQDSDIFAFPSRYEGFGLAMGEAMSAGLPVVACESCIPANELIKNGINGILCKDEVEEYAHGLEMLMKDKQIRAGIGKEAHESVKKFTDEIIWDKWEMLIKSIINE